MKRKLKDQNPMIDLAPDGEIQDHGLKVLKGEYRSSFYDGDYVPSAYERLVQDGQQGTISDADIGWDVHIQRALPQCIPLLYSFVKSMPFNIGSTLSAMSL